MSHSEFHLTVNQIYRASVERIFCAWTDPEALQQWFRIDEKMPEPKAENDLRTGGDYLIKMTAADGKRYQASGLYHEINEPVKLAFTWRWGDESDAEDTYVELTLRQLGLDETELTLFHDEFVSAAARDIHQKSWTTALAQLGVYLS